MRRTEVAIIGAGPYGLSIAAHLAARNIDLRIFGKPMQFWASIADAGGERYLKSFCFGTSLSTPHAGFTFQDYNRPRGLETFEPCSMKNFTEYGRWFQQQQVPAVEPVDVARVARHSSEFVITLETGERLLAKRVVVATGLSSLAHTPDVFASLPSELAIHTSRIANFEAFKGRNVAVVGGGQSALEAAALLLEAGAYPQLFVRQNALRWHSRTPRERNLWRKLRSPITGLGSGPKAWVLTKVPGAMHRMPELWRREFVKRHLPAEGAWWLRPRVEGKLPIHLGAMVAGASISGESVTVRVSAAAGTQTELRFDQVVAGCGYRTDVDKLHFLDSSLLAGIKRIEGSPRLNAAFESSVPGLSFAGPLSAMSFGPLFRFVAGAEHTAHSVCSQILRLVSNQRASNLLIANNYVASADSPPSSRA